MRLLFFSDLHGVLPAAEALIRQAESLQAKQWVFLGDALYHGPRNGIPGFYDPAAVAELLNEYADRILAVRGNCDTEVDQLMLHFPLLADYSQLLVDDRRIFLTHGHLFNESNPPPLPPGAVLAHGHTHIPELREQAGLTVFNPGSVALPKGGFPASFGFFDGKKLSIRRLADGEIIFAE